MLIDQIFTVIMWILIAVYGGCGLFLTWALIHNGMVKRRRRKRDEEAVIREAEMIVYLALISYSRGLDNDYPDW